MKTRENESGLPTVTIGVPFYNEGDFLKATLDSVLQQQYPHIRVVVSDNCSTDVSAEVAREYAARDNRIHLVRQEVNRGPAFNFRYVMEQADSKYFVWIGGHDVFLPNYIQDAVNLLEARPEIVVAYPKAEEIDQHDTLHGEIIADYDTVGLSTYDALVKIARNFHNGYAIHGVFRLDTLRKLPFEKVIGSDFLMLLLATTYGQIARIPILGFRRREVRRESYKTQTERHVQQGIYQNADNPFELLFVVLCKHVLNSGALSFVEKLKLIRELRTIFMRRFKLQTKRTARVAVDYWQKKQR